MRRIEHGYWRSIALVALAACGPSPAQTVPRPDSTTAGTTLIIRDPSYPDPELAARGLGRLEVAVRTSERPTQSLANSQVILLRSGRDTVKRLATDGSGVARFDSVLVGEYTLVVRRIGYGTARVSAPVVAGCRTDVETYIGIQALGINPPPPMPGRATVTTCKP